MKIFITGVSGFIGKQLIPILVQHELLCLTRSAKGLKSANNLQYVLGDLSNSESYLPTLEEFKPDCCIHLAWYGLPNYSLENNKINLISGINLVESLKKVGCKKIFAVGSCWEYGNAKNSLSESDFPIDPGVFAVFKTSLHMIINSICHENSINLIWGRVFFVYGPGQRQTSLIPSCYNSLKHGVEFKINNPLAVNDFIYVSDVANAIRHLIELDNISGVYNIGSGQGKAVWEVVNCIASALKISPVYKNMPSSNIGNWANINSISECGWKSEVSLEAGIFDTINALEAI
jgi:nucleoside-diphosphate-sugar epimerase